MTTAVAALAMPTVLWCSASQKRLYPQSSACRARSRELCSASAGVAPSVTNARSRIEKGGTRLSCRVVRSIENSCRQIAVEQIRQPVPKGGLTSPDAASYYFSLSHFCAFFHHPIFLPRKIVHRACQRRVLTETA